MFCGYQDTTREMRTKWIKIQRGQNHFGVRWQFPGMFPLERFSASECQLTIGRGPSKRASVGEKRTIKAFSGYEGKVTTGNLRDFKCLPVFCTGHLLSTGFVWTRPKASKMLSEIPYILCWLGSKETAEVGSLHWTHHTNSLSQSPLHNTCHMVKLHGVGSQRAKLIPSERKRISCSCGELKRQRPNRVLTKNLGRSGSMKRKLEIHSQHRMNLNKTPAQT